jgi:hypothetical protein
MASDWRLLPIGLRYHRISTDKDTAAKNTLEWVTPGHPLFESLRRNACETTRQDMLDGACFYSLNHDHPARLDIYRARVVDGLGNIVHERTFGVEVAEGADPVLRDSGFLGDLLPAPLPEQLPPVARTQEATAFLHDKALGPFLEEVRKERVEETDRVAAHIEISLTELIAKEDEKRGRFIEEKEQGIEGADGRLAKTEERDRDLTSRRERRRNELEKQKHMTLQNVERITTVLILPHPDRNNPEFCHLRSDPEVEAIAMEVVRKYEETAGRKVEDVHLKNLGYDITSVDLKSGELRLIEVKGLSAAGGNIILTPNEHRVANDRRDCFWLYVVTDCRKEPRITFIQDPAKYKWDSVVKIEHYTMGLDKMKNSTG